MDEAEERPRERFEILVDIVDFLARTGPQRQTHVMQACNLKHEQVVECLRMLEDNQLIQRISDEEGNRYQATARGVEFYRRWVEMVKYLFAIPKRRRYFWQK